MKVAPIATPVRIRMTATIPMTMPLMMRASSLLNTTSPKHRVWMSLSFDRNGTVNALRKSLRRPACTRSYKLKAYRRPCDRHCRYIGVDPVKHWRGISDLDETACFLYAFFSWRCDIRRGKHGRHCAGIQYKSSLETF